MWIMQHFPKVSLSLCVIVEKTRSYHIRQHIQGLKKSIVITPEKLRPEKRNIRNKGHPIVTAVLICLKGSLHVKSFSGSVP